MSSEPMPCSKPGQLRLKHTPYALFHLSQHKLDARVTPRVPWSDPSPLGDEDGADTLSGLGFGFFCGWGFF